MNRGWELRIAPGGGELGVHLALLADRQAPVGERQHREHHELWKRRPRDEEAHATPRTIRTIGDARTPTVLSRDDRPALERTPRQLGGVHGGIGISRISAMPQARRS